MLLVYNKLVVLFCINDYYFLFKFLMYYNLFFFVIYGKFGGVLLMLVFVSVLSG